MALSISFWRQHVVQKRNRDKTKIRAKLKTSPAKIRARLALKTCWLVQTTKKPIHRTATVLSVSGDCLKRLMSKILHYQAWLIIPMFKRLAISIKFLPISQIVRVRMTTVGQLWCPILKRSHTSSIPSLTLIWRMSSCQRRHKRLHCLSLISIYRSIQRQGALRKRKKTKHRTGFKVSAANSGRSTCNQTIGIRSHHSVIRSWHQDCLKYRRRKRSQARLSYLIMWRSWCVEWLKPFKMHQTGTKRRSWETSSNWMTKVRLMKKLTPFESIPLLTKEESLCLKTILRRR